MRFRLVIISAVLLLCLGVLGYYGYVNINKRAGYDKLSEQVYSSIQRFPGEVGVYIKDLRTGATIKFNEKTLFPSASLVKIPLMAAVFYAASENRLSLDEKIKLCWRHKVGGSGKLKNRRAGREFPLRELLEMMVTESDNTACNMLTERLGADYINQLFAEKLGLRSTNFARKIMDLGARKRGEDNYTTAEEMGELLEKIYRGRLVNEEASFAMLDILLRQKIRDRIPRFLPTSMPVAHKTGLMRSQCHDAGIIFTSRGDFVVCVLTSDIKSLKLAKILIGDIAYKASQYY